MYISAPDLEYTPMTWGDELVTLLCPGEGAEPYIAIPELVSKVYTCTYAYIHVVIIFVRVCTHGKLLMFY